MSDLNREEDNFFFQETNKSYIQFSINEYISERKNQQVTENVKKQTNNQQNINKTGHTH